MLKVRADNHVVEGARQFDTRAESARVCIGTVEHVVIERDGALHRFDVIEGSVRQGPVALTFLIADEERADTQLGAVRAFCTGTSATPPIHRLAGKLLALHAVDARDTGACLREIADILLGPGDWPGDGEHRKSRLRRLLVAGDDLIRAGPGPILSGGARAC